MSVNPDSTLPSTSPAMAAFGACAPPVVPYVMMARRMSNTSMPVYVSAVWIRRHCRIASGVYAVIGYWWVRIEVCGESMTAPHQIG